MSVETGKELFRLGFLTAIEIPDRGYVGGLLVTNHFGRPLEFQCTAPLKPNRTQQILYGPTLIPYVLGDLIGRTLLEKVGVKPHIVLTERPELLGLRKLVEIPIACVDDLPPSEQAALPARESAPSAPPGKTIDTDELVPAAEPVSVIQPAIVNSAETFVVESSTEETLPLAEALVSETAPADTTSRRPLSRGTRDGNGTPDQDPAEPKRLNTPQAGTQNISRTQDSSPPAPASEVTMPVVADGSAIQLGRQVLRFHASHVGDRSVASRGARVVPSNADLREPFERVREALGESARLGGSR